MDYYEGTGNDPLEAINSILRLLKYSDRGEIESWNHETGKDIDYDQKPSASPQTSVVG